MNREIRFRAWDKEHMIMEDWDTITGYTDFQPWWKQDSLILMQYTGSDDLDGEPIYEFDVVNVREVGREDWSHGVVHFKHGGWYVHDCPFYDIAEFELVNDVWSQKIFLQAHKMEVPAWIDSVIIRSENN